MSTNRIGWAVQDYAFAIKQGSAGSYRVTLTVTQSDGSALPTYDGWTAELDLFSNFGVTPTISLTPTVTGDAVAKTLTMDLTFTESMTANVEPQILRGDIFLTQPTSGDLYTPANITLTVEKSYSL